MKRFGVLRVLAVLALLAGGVFALVHQGGHDRLAALAGAPLVLFIWACMTVAVALAPFPRPRGRGPVVWSPAVDVAALLAFGPLAAAGYAVLGRMAANTAQRWRPLLPSMFRVARGLAAVAAAGWAHTLMGGDLVDPLAGPDAFWTAVGALIAYAVADSAAWGLGGVLSGARPGSRWGDGLRRCLARNLVVLPLGALAVAALGDGGGAVGALLLVPVLLSWAAGRYARSVESSQIETLRKLTAAIDAGDPFRRGYAYRISKMSVKVASHLRLPAWEVRQIEIASLLHDIGRTAIHHELWGKPGRLTREEENVLRVHPRIGADLVRGFGCSDPAADIILAHHEQPDGKGYPRGLTGEAIPTGSRIIMAVAAFDAMTSDRPYRRGLGPEAAFEELLAHSGTQFFPEVVEALIELYSKGTLFDEFAAEEIERYREGELTSRALERVIGRTAPVPEKRGLDETQDGDGVPVIDFPEPRKGLMAEAREYPLGGDLRLIVGGLSDLGCVRQNNEDAYGVFQGNDARQGILLVLADGMGGAAAGEVASRLAVDGVCHEYFATSDRAHPADALLRSIQTANASIYTRAASEPDLKGMGTTCTALSLVGSNMIVAHVGDSRAYLVAGEAIHLLTRDHTLAAELAHMGGGMDLAPEGAKNVLTRCLGNQPEVQVEMSNTVRLPEDCALVLCSDGLSNMVDAEEIREIVTAQDPAEACETLVTLARERGGPDNITVQVARLVRG
jgi:protein phosphatase